MIELDDTGEFYEVDGHKLPRVTHLIREAGLGFWSDDEGARALGTAVHRGTALFDHRDLDWDSLDPMVRPRIAAWQRCKREIHFRVHAIEKRVVDPMVRYAGRLDRLLSLGDEKIIADFSIGHIPREKGIQMALYAACFSSEPIARIGIELREDATYKITDFPATTYRADLRAGLACLAAYEAKQELECWKGRKP